MLPARVPQSARQRLAPASPSAWRPSIPPHNAAELCDAALHLIDNPNARAKTLLKYVPGPDFPTGGIIVDTPRERSPRPMPPAAARSACARAGRRRTPAAAPDQIVVTEIPWQVQKARLIERIAELLNDKKLPLLADVRDEIGRGRPHRHRAEAPHGRSRAS